MSDEAPEGMEWYYGPGQTEPTLRPIPSAVPLTIPEASDDSGEAKAEVPGSSVGVEGVSE